MERHVHSVALLSLVLIFAHVGFIAAPPALTVPPALPASQTVDQGQVAYVSVATPTGGSTPYTYQWFEESPGAGTFALANDCALQTTLACTFSTGTGTATGTYLFLLQVTDKKGTIVNSSTATVNVNTALSVPTPSASNHTIDQGQLSTLSSISPTTGTPPYGYQWFLKGPANSSFSVIPGATSSSYAFTTSGATPIGTFEFELQVTDSATTNMVQNSLPVQVTVNTAMAVPAPTASPSSITQGDTSTLSEPSPSAGTPPYTYQWFIQSPGSGTCSPIPGATEPIYQFATTPYTVPGIYSFKVQVSDSASFPLVINSSNVTVSVASLPPSNALGTPSISCNAHIYLGQTSTVIASIPTSEPGTPPYTYQFTVIDGSGSVIASAAYAGVTSTTNTFTFTPVSVGSFFANVVVTDSNTIPNVAASSETTILVNNPANPAPSGGGNSPQGVITNDTIVGLNESLKGIIPEPITNGFLIKNMTQTNSVSVTIGDSRFNVTENFITPEYAGITVNNKTYEIYPDQPTLLKKLASDFYYMKITNLSINPSKDTIWLQLYRLPNNKSDYVVFTQNSTTNVTLSASTPLTVDLFGLDIELSVKSAFPGRFVLTVSNLTSNARLPPRPQGYNASGAIFNISAKSTIPGDTAFFSVAYPTDCFIQNETTTPFLISNNSWSEIRNYLFDKSTCEVTFSFAKGGIIALMERTTTPAPQAVQNATSAREGNATGNTSGNITGNSTNVSTIPQDKAPRDDAYYLTLASLVAIMLIALYKWLIAGRR